MADEVKSGIITSEYQSAQASQFWGTLGIILGAVISIGSAVAQAMGQDTKVGIIVGAAVAIAGQVQQTLTSLGYIKSRTDIKVASSTGNGSTTPPAA